MKKKTSGRRSVLKYVHDGGTTKPIKLNYAHSQMKKNKTCPFLKKGMGGAPNFKSRLRRRNFYASMRRRGGAQGSVCAI